MLGQATAIASLKRIQPRVDRDATAHTRMRPERNSNPLSPVDVLDPFHDQHLALSCWQIRRRSSSSGVGVRTDVSRPAVRRAGLGRVAREAKSRRRSCQSWPDAAGGGGVGIGGCIDNMTLNSFAQQDTVNPEAVQPRFLNDDDWEGFSGPRARLPPELWKSAPAAQRYPRRTRCAWTSSLRGPATAMSASQQSIGSSSNETNMAQRSAPIVVGAAD